MSGGANTSYGGGGQIAAPGFTPSVFGGTQFTTSPSYQISNVSLLYDLVMPASDFAAQIERLALSSSIGMAFKFDAFSTQTTTRTGLAVNSTVTFTSSVNFTKTKALFAFFRDNALVATPAYPLKMNTWIFPGLVNYQWQVGSRRFPDFLAGDATGWPIAYGATGVAMDSANGNFSQVYRSGLTESYSYLQDALGQYGNDKAGGVVNLGNYWKNMPIWTGMASPGFGTPGGGSPVVPYTPATWSTMTTQTHWSIAGVVGTQFFQFVPCRFALGLNLQVVNDAMLGADLRSTAPNTQLTMTLGGNPSSSTQAAVWASKSLEYTLVAWYDMYITIKGGIIGISK